MKVAYGIVTRRLSSQYRGKRCFVLPPTQHAIQVKETGGPDKLQLTQVPLPDVIPRHVLIRNAFSGVNFHDTYTRSGLYPRALPLISGCEGAGVVVAQGHSSGGGGENELVGKRVAYFSEGSYAEYTLVDENMVCPIPDEVGFDTAAALFVQGLTAHYLVNSSFKLTKDHTCLVHAAAGGTGRLVCLMAKQAGARVIATVGSASKLEQVREYSDHALLLPAEMRKGGGTKSDIVKVADEVRRLTTQGEGCDVVYDGVGFDTSDLSMAVTRPRGLVVFFGNASGAPRDINPLSLAAAGSLYVTRPILNDYIRSPGEMCSRANEIWTLAPKIDRIFPLSEAVNAHQFLESRGTRGKVLLDCSVHIDKLLNTPASAKQEVAGIPPTEELSLVQSAIDCDGVCTLTMSDPKTLNSLSDEMLTALKSELIALKRNSAARVVILAGAGRAFCPGHNLKQMHSKRNDSSHAKELFALCSEVMLLISDLPQPVIARVHGIATAAGCQLVATCDLAVASESARFATSGINLDFFCTTPGVALGRSVSKKHAMELLLTGKTVDAKKAAEIGLVNSVVPDDELDGETLTLAKSIAEKSAYSLALGKRAFYRHLTMPLKEAYAFAGEEMATNFEHVDAAEGIGAFVEKRPRHSK